MLEHGMSLPFQDFNLMIETPRSLGGTAPPTQKLACFVLYLKIIIVSL